MSTLDKLASQSIMRTLRRRYPFLLVDSALEVEVMKRARGYKKITLDETIISGEVTNESAFPGVLILEAMSQVGAMLFTASKVGYLVSIQNVKFLKYVALGDQLVTEATYIQHSGPYAKVMLEAMVDKIMVAKAEVTYYFEH